jgi:LacI family transcriptional regulator
MALDDATAVPTLADVAQRAGVSKATASKALANRYDVRPGTRERVLQAARELNFTPNLLARGLGGGKTQTVGVITSDLQGRFTPPIMMGAEDALGADRSSVIMCNSRGNPDLEKHHIQDLLRRSVDGLIMVGDSPEPRAPIALRVPVPVVYAYAFSSNPTDTSVVCDNIEAGRQATRHLIDCGKRAIAYLGGPETHLAARDRAAGSLAGLADSGLQLTTNQPLFGDWTEQWGWEATSQLLDDGIDFDALVCGNDQIARGAIDQLDAQQYRIPDDVAVIGFDNWSVLCKHSRRPFTSVDMNLDQVGRAAAQAIIAEGGPRAGIQRITGRVVVRSSTCRPWE